MTVGCPGQPWFVWALAFVGFCVVVLGATVLYQLAYEVLETKWKR